MPGNGAGNPNPFPSNSAANDVTALTGNVAISSAVKPDGILAEEEAERRAYCWRPAMSGVRWLGLPRPKTWSPIEKVETEDPS